MKMSLCLHQFHFFSVFPVLILLFNFLVFCQSSLMCIFSVSEFDEEVFDRSHYDLSINVKVLVLCV